MTTPRPSVPVREIAAALACSENHVRKLVDAGELEAHRIGARQLRVYLDSLAAFRERRRVYPNTTVRVPAPRKRTRAARESYDAALENCRRLGTLPPVIHRRSGNDSFLR